MLHMYTPFQSPFTSMLDIDAVADVKQCSNTVSVREEFINLFFKGEALQRVMTYFCNTCAAHYVDPITTIVVMMLKNPIQCAINEQGICPFKSHPIMTFPFSRMNTEQQIFISNIQLIENHTLVSVHSLMGGGQMFMFYEHEQPHYVSHIEALVEICKATLSHPNYASEQRLQVCNIVLQRVAALVNISNSTLKTINEILRARIVEMQDIKSETQG
jgi:hypothetical protein